MADAAFSSQDDGRKIDLEDARRSGGRPVPGAQWDEVRSCWEHWDEATQSWRVVGAETRVPEPAIVADVAMAASDITDLLDGDDDDQIIDIDRLAAPAQAVPGAQWNEVMGRWERWDDGANAWVAVPSNADAF